MRRCCCRSLECAAAGYCEEQEHEELSGLPVLVVDDELAVCESAAMLLQELGMRGSWVL